MKTEPTDLDREAAELFTFERGMRVLWRTLGGNVAWGSPDQIGAGRPLAIDADDSKTKGIMFAQLEQAAGAELEINRNWAGSNPGGARIRFRLGPDGHWPGSVIGQGASLGAALVAAMRALKGKP